MKKITTDEFIKRSKNIHGNKYDYSLVKYINMRTKIKIICPNHGVFEQTPNRHLFGNACPKCYLESKNSNNDKFIKKANKTHNNKYDYSLVKYINNKTKVKIICPKHGIFEQTPSAHLQKRGCKKCSTENQSYSKNEFIKRSNKIHKNKFDYSLVDIHKDKIKIICPIHGVFEQNIYLHLRGYGCKKCSDDSKKSNKDKFVKKSKKIHSNKYDYSLVEYINNRIKVKIICPKHGVFEQKPISHINKQGFPICNESKGEKEISIILEKYNIKHIREKKV